MHDIEMMVQEHVKGGMPVLVAMQTVLAAPTQEAFPSRGSWFYSFKSQGGSSGHHSHFEKALEQWKEVSQSTGIKDKVCGMPKRKGQCRKQTAAPFMQSGCVGDVGSSIACCQLTTATVPATTEAPSAAVARGRKRSALGHHRVKLSRERSPTKTSPQLGFTLPLGIHQNTSGFNVTLSFYSLKMRCYRKTFEHARSCLSDMHDIKIIVQDHVKGGMPVLIAMQTVLAAPDQEAFPNRVSWFYSFSSGRVGSSGSHPDFERALKQWKEVSQAEASKTNSRVC